MHLHCRFSFRHYTNPQKYIRSKLSMVYTLRIKKCVITSQLLEPPYIMEHTAEPAKFGICFSFHCNLCAKPCNTICMIDFQFDLWVIRVVCCRIISKCLYDFISICHMIPFFFSHSDLNKGSFDCLYLILTYSFPHDNEYSAGS